MRQHIGEFLVAAAGVQPDLRQQLTAEAYLRVLEKQLSRAVEEHTIKKQEAQAAQSELRTLENVLLRYEDPMQWRNYLKALGNRKKWWDKRENCPASNAPDWARRLWTWLPDEASNWPAGDPTSKILEASHQRLREAFYSPDRRSFLSPPLREDRFDRFLDEFVDQLRHATCREFLCHWIGGALHV
jgi:hypothetical protein